MGFTKIDGLKIHYHAVHASAAGEGQRVLYIHGTGCNTRLWEQHMTAIADTHTPVAIDLPGHGQSEGNGFRGVADYSHFAVQLAAALGWNRFVVAGHSLGGAIALAIATYHAELLNGLMLIDTGARLRVHPIIVQRALEAARTGRPIVSVDASWAYASSTPQSVIDTIQAKTADTDPWVTYKDWICDDSFDFTTRLKYIDLPTLAVCGAEDRLTPVKYHTFFQQHIRGCQLVVIPNAGHWVYVEQPQAFTKAVTEFLDGLPASASAAAVGS